MERYRILWAEDEGDLRHVMCELLSLDGYSCTQASNGLEAKETLEKEDFNLLITDFNMPKMNGTDLLIWCRKNNKHFPVIFITANKTRLPEEVEALKDCCSSILHKPVSIEELLHAIEDAKKDHTIHKKGSSIPFYSE